MNLDTIKKLIALLVIISLPALTQAQQTPQDPQDTANGVPIDGGLGILLGAGALYAAKKLRKPPMKNSDSK